MSGDLHGFTRLGELSLNTTGQAVSPFLYSSSESSLGVYRSAASTLAVSYGTFSVGGQLASAQTTKISGQLWAQSGLSVGSSANTGSLLNAISAVSLALPAHVVQGSASSFTLFAWPAARPLDGILVAPLGAAISSISSGLVFHSHCTVAGQVEIRISNVSTLVQNQSAITLALYRLSAF